MFTSPPRSRFRVLVVEDASEIRQLLRVVLQAEGYDILEADNGVSAVELAASARPDAIIMDMSLPVLDGYQAAKRIRMVPGMRDIPIIACTAFNRWEWRAKAIAAGCSAFVTKPIDFGLLSGLLSQQLNQGLTL
jgi:CheY-like chemotaxis protein